MNKRTLDQLWRVRIEWMTGGKSSSSSSSSSDSISNDGMREISLKMVHNLYYYHANVSLLIFESNEIDEDHMCVGCIFAYMIVRHKSVHFGKIVEMHDFDRTWPKTSNKCKNMMKKESIRWRKKTASHSHVLANSYKFLEFVGKEPKSNPRIVTRFLCHLCGVLRQSVQQLLVFSSAHTYILRQSQSRKSRILTIKCEFVKLNREQKISPNNIFETNPTEFCAHMWCDFVCGDCCYAYCCVSYN